MATERKEQASSKPGLKAPDEDARERQLVEEWLEEVGDADAAMGDLRKEWRKLRRLAKTGLTEQQRSDKKAGALVVSTNLISSTKKTLLPALYARNPDVSARPAEQIRDEDYHALRTYARTYELLLHHFLFKPRRLKRALKRVLRAKMDAGHAWVKLTWRDEREENPIIKEQLADLRERLEHMKSLAEDAGNPEIEDDDREAEAERLRIMIQKKEPLLERIIFRGFMPERVLPDDIIRPDSIDELQDYEEAPWLAQRIWLTRKRAQAIMDLDAKDLATATIFDAAGDEDPSDASKGGARTDPDDWLKSYEIWSLQDGMVYTVVCGVKKWAREPFSPTVPRSGDRWYPFFLYADDWVEGEPEPMSDVEAWSGLQEEYTRTRTAFALHRRRCVPVRAFNKQVVDPADAERMSNGELLENIGFDVPPEVPLDGLFTVPRLVPIDPALYDTAPIRADMDMESGVQDARRGEVLRAKTAEEASILDAGYNTRLSGPQDELTDMIEDMANYAGGILRTEVTAEEVTTICGEGADWPTLSVADEAISVEVSAGTTGKPNAARQQKVWLAAVGELVQMGEQLVGAEQQGNMMLATLLRAVMEETLRQLDIRIDLNELIPTTEAPAEQAGPQGPGAPAGAVPGAGVVPAVESHQGVETAMPEGGVP